MSSISKESQTRKRLEEVFPTEREREREREREYFSEGISERMSERESISETEGS